MTNEFDIISKFFAPLSGEAGLGLKDDAALLKPRSGYDMVVTKDLIVEGQHFFKGTNPTDLAWKALAVNLSDLAAKGAVPIYYFLGLALPKNTPVSWFEAFSNGLSACQKTFGFSLAGGDTTSTNSPVVVSVTMIGEVASSQMIRRSGAQEGDDIYVTGTLGDSALALKLLLADQEATGPLVDRYLRPVPRLSIGVAIQNYASASADISDGLLADLGHICRASGVGADLKVSTLPLSPEANAMLTRDTSLTPLIYSGGDDYELVFTAPSVFEKKLAAISNTEGVPVTKIGTISSELGVRLVDPAGNLVHVESDGFKHF